MGGGDFYRGDFGLAGKIVSARSGFEENSLFQHGDMCVYSSVIVGGRGHISMRSVCRTFDILTNDDKAASDNNSSSSSFHSY